MTEPPPPQQPHQTTTSDLSGIDIHRALDILAARSKHDDGSHNDEHNDSGAGGCGCGSHNVSEEAKSLGQTIDLMRGEKTSDEEAKGDETAAAAAAQAIEKRQNLAQERQERQVQIRERLQAMSVKELLNAVFEAQRERVVTYQEYDRGLETVLRTGNLTNYPNNCAHATASFSVLSDTINTIQAILVEQHHRSDLKKLLRKLQKQEQEKLNVTAALHLERIRERNEEMQAKRDDTTANLLQEGVATLSAKVAGCVDAINEVLEELRYEAADETE